KPRKRHIMTMISEMLPWDIDVHFDQAKPGHHYQITPYAFQPRIGRKLVLNEHVDLGQGLLDCIEEIYQQINHRDEDSATLSSTHNQTWTYRPVLLITGRPLSSILTVSSCN